MSPPPYEHCAAPKACVTNPVTVAAHVASWS